MVDGGLNDIQIGDLEGKTLDDYRDWKDEHTRDDPFPGGESLNDAARRYADAFERVLDRPEANVLVVCHEIPVRYAVNAAAGSDDLDWPLHKVANAAPYVFDAAGLRRAVDQIRRLAAPEHVERA
jgi:broad specificity phosphatase PhoE